MQRKQLSLLELAVVVWCLFSGLFTFTLAGIMLVDKIPPSELAQCLDQSAQSHMTSSR